MPVLTRTFIKLSLIYFLAALIAAILIALSPLLESQGFPLYSLTPVYFHLFMVGWVTQLIFGMVYWMFPKFTREAPHASETAAWSVFWLLNIGLILRVIGEPLAAARPEPGLGWLLVVSAVLQWFAGVIFILNTWGRVKER